ncbi:hypothetical protein [Paenibacillus sp. NEAU-GSW1]|uniref:hypothetical protein n=1 Tax=Paenibacillus sp. NEAU-GSW1 TaxID=2682486 RepID=UPI0012E1F9E1|nr:hypothetical protein [Paenibacillus sp. NEAU-GSW1]MUT65511.1 hypothetical protein [Paenibacillus sp. NEAU-GSW1]
MKLGGFLFGSVLGMAAAVYVARKRPGTAAWASAALASACSMVGRKTVSMMTNSANWKAQAVSSAPKRTDGTAAKSEGSWAQIEALVNSDPKLKAQADQIMAESSSQSNQTH